MSRERLTPDGWLRLPRRTIRLRLTLLYGALFLISGAALLAVTYVLVEHQYTQNGASFFISGNRIDGTGGAVVHVTSGGGGGGGTLINPAALQGDPTPAKVQALAQAQSSAALHGLLVNSAIALAIMAALSIWLGWLIAGRALRPLRTITNAARDISASSLHKRLALAGPDDELTQLAVTFDDLLARLEGAFDAQRGFVANASHELRTPLTLERTLVEVALADPNATVASLRATCERVLAAGEQQERLIEALLTLSRSQRGLDHREVFDLAAVAADVLATRRPDAEQRELRLEANLAPASVAGDAGLGERLVANLIDNALRHNHPGGEVEITTTTQGGTTLLSISNSGPIVPPDETDRLLQPFQRLAGNRDAGDDGLGLGLSIVNAIAIAHGATLTTQARPQGGLTIDVSFPA